MDYFLYEEQFNQFIPLQDGLFCGRYQYGVKLSPKESAATIHCQFRLRNGVPHIVDLRGEGRTRVNGEVLEWGVARRLELNDVVELGQRKLVVTNRKVYNSSLVQDRTVSVPKEQKTENPALKGATGLISNTALREIHGLPQSPTVDTTDEAPSPAVKKSPLTDLERFLRKLGSERVELEAVPECEDPDQGLLVARRKDRPRK